MTRGRGEEVGGQGAKSLLNKYARDIRFIYKSDRDIPFTLAASSRTLESLVSENEGQFSKYFNDTELTPMKSVVELGEQKTMQNKTKQLFTNQLRKYTY